MPPRNLSKSDRDAVSSPILLGIGANLQSPVGPPKVTISRLLAELQQSELAVQAVSKYYQTRAFPPSSGPDYVNAAVWCESDLGAGEVLAVLHGIEDRFGRKRNRRWDARTLDIDLLAVGSQVSPDKTVHEMWRELPLHEQQTRVPDELILPHPRMQERGFVLVPLADVAPDWVHPILEKSVAEMLAELPKSARAGISEI